MIVISNENDKKLMTDLQDQERTLFMSCTYFTNVFLMSSLKLILHKLDILLSHVVVYWWLLEKIFVVIFYTFI